MVGPFNGVPYSFGALRQTFGPLYVRCDVCRRYALPTVVAWWILIGLLLGFATDFVLVAAGA